MVAAVESTSWHPMPTAGLADLDAIVARAMAAWRPPPRLSLSEWADRNFVISAESGAQPGRWHTLPYQREILDAITDPRVSMVVVMKSARIGYTLSVTAAIAYFIDQDPSSMLVVQPTVDDAKGFSKETIAPMLRDVPVLAKLTYRDSEDKGKGPKDSSATLTHKSFPGGVLSLVGANSGAGFRRISRRVVIFDEVDAYPPSAGSEGDQIKLGMKRSEAFHDRKTIAGSTPLVAGASRIEDMFLAGDQRRYHVPCPHCGHRDFLVFDQKSDRGHVMRWPDGKPEEAYFECRGNGCKIEHKSKRWMVERGEWIPGNPAGAHRSYHLWSAISYSPNTTWADIAREFLAAKSDPLKLRTFVNTMLGETWQERGEAPEWERLHARRETYKIGTVPEGVIVLTAGVDVQQDRFVYEVVGWGENKESWSIDAGRIDGDTARPETWAKLDEFLDRTFEGHDGAIHTIAKLAIDSGYRTQSVYAWGHRRGRARVMVTKGMSGVRPILDAPSKVEISINGRKLRRGMTLWPVGVDSAKAELYGWLGLPWEPGTDAPSGYCHFPEHGPEFFKQLTAEHLVETTNRRTGRKQREWHVLPNRENHHLDTRILARAAVFSLRIDYMRSGSSAKAAARPTAVASSSPSSEPPPPVSPSAPPPPRPPRGETGRPSGFLNRPGGGGRGGWFGRRR
jgi:phage terminase large subunit GpA-like protein